MIRRLCQIMTCPTLPNMNPSVKIEYWQEVACFNPIPCGNETQQPLNNPTPKFYL